MHDRRNAQQIKIGDSEINLVVETHKFKQYKIEKIVIKYLNKVPKDDLKAVETIYIYDDTPEFYPANISGGYFSKKLMGKSGINIYLCNSLPGMHSKTPFSVYRDRFFLYMYGELIIANTLFHEVGHLKNVELLKKSYKNEEEAEKDAEDYASELLINSFPLRACLIPFFKFLFRGRTEKDKKISSLSHKLNPEYFEAMGNTHLKLKEFDRAVKAYSDLININPNHPDAYAYRGAAYLELGNNSAAIEDYTKAIDINSSNAMAHFNRGVAYQKKEEWQKAINDYSSAINLGFQQVEAFIYRGHCYDELGDSEKAIDDFTQAIDMGSTNPDSYYNRGCAYATLEKYDEAIEDFTKALELDSKHISAYFNRGLAYVLKEHYDDAITDLTKAIILGSNDAKAYFNRGYCHYMKKDYKSAINDYTLAIELNPDNAEILYNLACVYSLIKDDKKACQALRDALVKGYPKDEQIKKDADFDNIRDSECFQKIIKA